jgi:hypothetical protein
MAPKKPMTGVVMSAGLKADLLQWSGRERRSLSNLCSNLLRYAERQLGKHGSLVALMESSDLKASEETNGDSEENAREKFSRSSGSYKKLRKDA